MEDYEERFNYALSLRDKDDLVGAIEVLKEILDNDPPVPAPTFAVMAHLYFKLGDFNNALCNYQEATKLAPKSENGSLGLFHTLWRLGRRDDAFAEARRFLALKPSEEYELMFEEIGQRP